MNTRSSFEVCVDIYETHILTQTLACIRTISICHIEVQSDPEWGSGHWADIWDGWGEGEEKTTDINLETFKDKRPPEDPLVTRFFGASCHASVNRGCKLTTKGTMNKVDQFHGVVKPIKSAISAGLLPNMTAKLCGFLGLKWSLILWYN